MGENLLLIVPRDDVECAARAMAIAEALWDLGLVPRLALDGPWAPFDAERDELFRLRAKNWRATGRELNASAFEQLCDSVSVWRSDAPMLVPYSFQSAGTKLHCPRCDGPLSRGANHPRPDIPDPILPDEKRYCPHCGSTFRASELVGRGGPIAWTRFAICLNDLADPDCAGDSLGIGAIREVLGPSICLPGWST
jgi:uncharacterized Zn-finger protein